MIINAQYYHACTLADRWLQKLSSGYKFDINLSKSWDLFIEDFESTISEVVWCELKYNKLSSSYCVRSNQSRLMAAKKSQERQFLPYSLSNDDSVTSTTVGCRCHTYFSYSQYNIMIWLNLDDISTVGVRSIGEWVLWRSDDAHGMAKKHSSARFTCREMGEELECIGGFSSNSALPCMTTPSVPLWDTYSS